MDPNELFDNGDSSGDAFSPLNGTPIGTLQMGPPESLMLDSTGAIPIDGTNYSSISSAPEIPLSDKQPLTEEEKRKRKLERNREVARKSRYRKRERATALEQENARLREINRQLELKLKLRLNQLGMATSGRSGRDKEEEEKRAADVKIIEKLVTLKSTEEQIKNRLNYYKETYSDFGQERRSLIDVHLQQVKSLLLPNQVSKVLLWLFQQDEAFYQDKSKGSIWQLLCKELQLNETQIEKVMDQRKSFNRRKNVLYESLDMLKKLHQQMEREFASRKGQMAQFEKILSTSQEAKFLVWVENNKACVHLLNTMWMNVEGTKIDGEPIEVAGNEPPGAKRVKHEFEQPTR